MKICQVPLGGGGSSVVDPYTILNNLQHSVLSQSSPVQTKCPLLRPVTRSRHMGLAQFDATSHISRDPRSASCSREACHLPVGRSGRITVTPQQGVI